MRMKFRCTWCPIRFDTVRGLLEHAATHEAGRARHGGPTVIAPSRAQRTPRSATHRPAGKETTS